jgi:hypothetical protein
MFSDNTDPTHESNKVVSIINYTYLKPYMCTIQEFIEQKYFGILYTLNKIQKIKIKCDEFNTSFMYEFKLNIPREFSIDEIKLQSTYNIDDKSIEKINEYIKIHFEKSKEFIDEKEKKNRDAIEELKEIAQKQITEL